MRGLSAIAVFVLLISCGSQIPEGAVMVVGERVLYPGDVDETMERVRGDSAAVMVMRDNILARELFLEHASEMGLDTLPENVRRLYERRREVLQNVYIQRITGAVTVTPEEIQAFTDSLGYLVVYSAFSTPDSSIMAEFTRRLGQGEDFNALVSELAADDFIRQTGGRVGPTPLVRTNREDYAVLRTLQPGQVSEPFFRRPGWRVVEMEDLRYAELTPEEIQEHQPDMSVQALRRETAKLIAQDSLVSAGNLRIDPEACRLIAARAGSPRGDYEPFTPEEQEIPAITWNGGSRSLISLAMNITELPSAMPRDATDPDWIENYAFWLGLYDLQAVAAREWGLDTIPENAAYIRRRQAETLLDQYYLEVLKDRMVPDEELLQQLYTAARDTMTIPEARRFRHAAAQGPEQVELLNRLFREGADPVEHTDSLTLIPLLSESAGSSLTRPMNIEEFPETFREGILGLEPGEAMVCSLETNFQVYFRLEEVIPEHSPELEEIRDLLEPRVMAEVEVRVITALVDSLKEVYHPYIHEEYFQSFCATVDSTVANPSPDERREEGQ